MKRYKGVTRKRNEPAQQTVVYVEADSFAEAVLKVAAFMPQDYELAGLTEAARAVIDDA